VEGSGPGEVPGPVLCKKGFFRLAPDRAHQEIKRTSKRNNFLNHSKKIKIQGWHDIAGLGES
jgi:hypothetical protein